MFGQVKHWECCAAAAGTSGRLDYSAELNQPGISLPAAVGPRWVSELAHLTFMYLNAALQAAV